MNSVTIYGDYIHSHWEGHQDLETVKTMDADLVAAVNKFKAQNKPILLLVSAHNSVEKFELGLFKEALKVMDETSFNRVALFGEIPNVIITVANTIMHTFSRDFEMKHFPDKEQAIAWLRKYR